MEAWRPERIEEKRPKALSARSLCIAFSLHVAFFAVCWGVSAIQPRSDEVITPIDLTVVVVENLDGVENEPPPLEKPQPEPPPPPPPKQPQPKPKPKEPEPPKELEKIVTNIVEKVEKKKEEKKEAKEPEKKKEKAQPEKPKKTAKELREERIKRMRANAKDAKTPPSRPQPNGRTDRKTLTDAEIRKLLNEGYRPGTSTNLAASEEQFCYSLIKEAFESKWDEPPWTDTLRPMTIRVWFGPGGTIKNFKLEQSSGDPKADATIKSAASRVGAVRNLTSGFIDKYKGSGVPVRFTVKPK